MHRACYVIIVRYVLLDLITTTYIFILKLNLILNFGALVLKDHKLYHKPISTVVL
jgi:hypothetical protein